MKIYLAYANIPYDIYYDKIKGLIENSSNLFRYNEKTNTFVGLYAWTKKEHIMKEFKKTRSKCQFYIFKTIKMNKEEYNEFKTENYDMKLDYHNFSHGDFSSLPDVSVVTTRIEDHIVHESDSEYLIIDDLMNLVFYDYYWFNDRLTNALDLLCYTSNHDLFITGESDYFSEDEIFEGMELASYNANYQLTVLGNKYIDLFDNKFALLLYLFKYMFIGGE